MISYAFLLLFLVGLYLIVPSQLYFYGYLNKNPIYLKKAVNLSINPYEKRLCYEELANIYGGILYDDYKKYDTLDGNKSIEYYEKAYKKGVTSVGCDWASLANLYLLKGDYNKVIEIENTVLPKSRWFTLQVYILRDEYQKALDLINSENKTDWISLLLKADLLRKVGDDINAKTICEDVEKKYESMLTGSQDFDESIIERYNNHKSVEAFKEYISNQSKLYKFKK